jgi:hypothetical protein
MGAAVAQTGYDADLDIVRSREARTAADAPALREMPGVPGWRSVDYDPGTRRVSVRRGTGLDLGAMAKAHAADTIASRLADWLPGGFLVNLGGDIAVAGRLPEPGWQIGVEGPMGVVQVVRGVRVGDADGRPSQGPPPSPAVVMGLHRTPGARYQRLLAHPRRDSCRRDVRRDRPRLGRAAVHLRL